jgi:CRP/FNR family transcriptional regulator
MKAVQEQKRARDLTTDDRAALIRRLEFGSTLDDSLVADLARSSVVLDFRRRRFVYRAGEPADCLYAIVHGRIKLCRIETETGREAVIDILPEGSLFGESGMAEDDRLHDYTFRLIGQRLDHAERRLADFALNAIPARLDSLLADFSVRYGVSEPEGVLIDIPLPHREIASIVGSTRESVTVRLNAMRREGTIAFVKRRILIKRPAAL